MNEEYKLVTPEMMSLRTYPCGVSAGDIISLKEDLHYQDHKGKPSGKVRPSGSEAMVLTGNPEEPDVVWFRWRDGERETWDSTILETFEITGKVA
jgi:hypothetical protein